MILITPFRDPLCLPYLYAGRTMSAVVQVVAVRNPRVGVNSGDSGVTKELTLEGLCHCFGSASRWGAILSA